MLGVFKISDNLLHTRCLVSPQQDPSKPYRPSTFNLVPSKNGSKKSTVAKDSQEMSPAAEVEERVRVFQGQSFSSRVLTGLGLGFQGLGIVCEGGFGGLGE